MSDLYILETHSFDVEGYPNCCGLDVATGFRVSKLDEQRYKEALKRYQEYNVERFGYWGRPDKPEEGKSLQTIYKWYEKRIADKRAAQLVQVALISKYAKPEPDGRTEQVPGFIDYLKKKKWEVQQVFINPAHGNEITILQKKFRGRNMKNW